MASTTPAHVGLPSHLVRFAALNDVWYHARQLLQALENPDATLPGTETVTAALKALQVEISDAWIATADSQTTTADDDVEGVQHG